MIYIPHIYHLYYLINNVDGVLNKGNIAKCGSMVNLSFAIPPSFSSFTHDPCGETVRTVCTPFLGVGVVNIQGTGERSGFSTPGFRYK